MYSMVSARTPTGIVLDGVDDHLVLDLGSVVFGGEMTIELIVIFTGFDSSPHLFDFGNGKVSDIYMTTRNVSTHNGVGKLVWSIHVDGTVNIM